MPPVNIRKRKSFDTRNFPLAAAHHAATGGADRGVWAGVVYRNTVELCLVKLTKSLAVAWSTAVVQVHRNRLGSDVETQVNRVK